MLNPAPACPIADALLALTDVPTLNERDLRLLAGLGVGASVEEAAQVLLKRGTAAMLVTLGAAGCALFRAVVAPVFLKGRQMVVTDTIGAGDTFTDALAAALARGEPLPEAMACANAAAAISVTGHGAIGAMPSLAQTRKLM